MDRIWLKHYPAGVPQDVDTSAYASLADMFAHCRLQLTGYKLPRQVLFRDEPLPKSPVGKILRRLVRDATHTQAEASR